MTERLGLMVEEAQTFTENTIFMTERLGLMVEEAQTFTLPLPLNLAFQS
jgi:hypothetical protein